MITGEEHCNNICQIQTAANHKTIN